LRYCQDVTAIDMQDAKNSVTEESCVRGAHGEAPLCRLVRSMVAMMGDCSDVLPANGAAEHVLFDVDVDGDRYILLKMIQMDRSVSSLSPREREIVRMVALGHPNKVIAAVLNISSWTVCTHLRRVFAKLGVTSRAAMVARVADITGVIETNRRAAVPARESNYPAARAARK
jgi:DNA-binding CsgD family transcriptional regulator